jgi:protein-disulfide isomerase
MKTNLTAGILALGIVGAGAWYLNQSPATSAVTEFSLVSAANAQEASTDGAEAKTVEIQEMVLGNPDSKVEVIEYASFTCIHCANFHNGALKELKKNYVDTNKIKFVYREVYFDAPGLWASAIARCGDGSKFFGISDLLYKDNAPWARKGSAAEVADELRKIGRLAGLENEQLESCLADRDKFRSLVEWFQANAEKDDITSTPSFVINGQKYSNMNYADFAALLDEKLAE